MSNDVIFKTFRTYRHPYAYDRHTNSLIVLTESEFDELSQVENGKLTSEQSPVLKKYQEQGVFEPNFVKKIEHASTYIIEHRLKRRVEQLVLQITQQCNLRCEYCAYSGIYEKNRTHSNNRMSFETAKKAIDFYFEHNIDLPNASISFYGGEPLLEFGLIKQCVEYTKSIVEGKTIRFNMTTNGTLLTDEIVEYLVENNIIVSVSLDGPKDEHDVNRKFANGKGSFDTIIHNIERIKQRYPEYESKIVFLTTINPYLDISCVLEFFGTNEVLNDKTVLFNQMNERDLNQEISYDEKFFQIRNYEYIKMLFSLVGKIDKNCVSGLFNSTKSALINKQKILHAHSPISSVCHHNGPCEPGVRRLFVSFDGVLYPCERVGDKLDYFNIGTLENGFNIDKIRKILNIGKLSEYECKNCWNLRQCSICAKEISFEEEPMKNDKLYECQNSCNRVAADLLELCVLNEFGLNIGE